MGADDSVIDHDRRKFLKVSAAAGGGLLIGFHLPWLAPPVQAAPAAAFAPNAWLRVDRSGTVTIMVGQSEMGQGIMTSLPMIVAEELEADWSKVRVEVPLADLAYARPDSKIQGTGSSASVRRLYEPLRRAGATGRQMLVSAAAKTWDTGAAECYAAKGFVIHQPSGRKLGYGQLVDKAAVLPVPADAPLKKPADFKIIGQPLPRTDTPQKVSGKAVYGIDVKVPGILTAVVARCPVFGGTVKDFNADKTKTIKGVRHVVPISSGVAVVADTFWAAKQGRDALTVNWDEGELADLDSDDLRKTYAELAQKPGAVARNDGNAEQAIKTSAKRIAAVYEVPFLAHATMEPMNCTAHVTKDGCEIWAPTQSQTRAQRVAGEITGIAPEAVKVHTTFLGGGFGRRSDTDYIVDAVEASKALGVPVKVIYTREDDMQHDFYRPATYNVMRAALDDQGRPVAWWHRAVGPSIAARTNPGRIKDGLDPGALQGAIELPYDIANIYVDHVMHNTIPVGIWRSVGDSQNAFVTQCFIDELAIASGTDPYEFRRRYLKSPRHKTVLELAATKAGWGQPLPNGVHRGIAVHFSYAAWVAQVAEVSVAADGNVKVHRVVCAVDCGTVVNPDTVKAQMEGGIVYGLTAALYGEITLEDGRAVQSNFDTYRMLRMPAMPKIEVYIVDSKEPPGGVGEPGVPPIAPAICNAIFAATGKRVRELPIKKTRLA